MEIAKVDTRDLEATIPNIVNSELPELNELQLALVGGGVGEVILG